MKNVKCIQQYLFSIPSLSRILIFSFVWLSALLTSTSASAEVLRFGQGIGKGDHDVEAVLVKGFDNVPETVPNPLGQYLDTGFKFNMDRHINYVDPLLHRDGSGGARGLYEYLRGAVKDSDEWPVRCENGCVLVTASTGDLIARVFLEKQAVWALKDGIAPFTVFATVDFVGAGGGTETADWWIYDEFRWLVRQTAGAFFKAWGFTMLEGFYGPVVTDLRPVNARKLAPNIKNKVPRFRISANTAGNFGIAFGPFKLSDANDMLVPAHSSCGVNKPRLSITSCVDHVDYKGYTHAYFKPISKSTISPEDVGAKLWPNHFPVIMASGAYFHGNTHINQRVGPITYIEKNPEKMGAGFDFKTDSHTDWGPSYIDYWDCDHIWGIPYNCKPVWKRDMMTRYQWIKGGSINRIVRDTFYIDTAKAPKIESYSTWLDREERREAALERSRIRAAEEAAEEAEKAALKAEKHAEKDADRAEKKAAKEAEDAAKEAEKAKEEAEKEAKKAREKAEK